MNFDISNDGVTTLQEGFERSRFGICVSNGDLEYAVNKFKEIENASIVGLHGHFSTSDRKVETYKNITKRLCEIAKQYIGDSLEYIDIGGGIYGELPSSFKMNTPTFDDYAEAICEIMNDEYGKKDITPYLILEPGNSMVANTFDFIAKVIEIKRIQDQYIVLIDGSVHNVKPTMHKRNLPMRIIKKDSNINPHVTYNIVGYTCMEKDYLAYGVNGELPMKDDYRILKNVGAYTIVLNPPLIKERPGIVAYDDDEFLVVRKKESFNEFFNEDLYVFK